MGMGIYANNKDTKDEKLYHSASVWNWGAIISVLQMANDTYLDGRLNLEPLKTNDGAELTASETIELADAADAVLTSVGDTIVTSERHGGHELMEELMGRPMKSNNVNVPTERVREFVDFMRISGGFKVI